MAKPSGSIEDLLSKKGKAQLKGVVVPTATATDDGSAPVKKTKSIKTNTELTSDDKLSDKLGDIKVFEEESATQGKAAANGVEYIDLSAFPVSGEALQTVEESVSEDNNLICFVNTGEEIRLGTTNPSNPKLATIVNQIEESQHAKVKVYQISERNLKNKLAQYAKLPKYKKQERGVSIGEQELEQFKEIAKDFKALNEHMKKVSMTDMVAFIIAAALQSRASDIHIEAEKDDVKVRFRVDGVLHEAAQIDKEKWNNIISRFKLLAGVKMNVVEKPQDGRITINLKEEAVDIRFSTLPTTWGESVVMRILKSSAASLQFEDLGVLGQAEKDLVYQTDRPNGMIITTGPTGSGKSTTLYAILNKLNEEGTKIITLEDPVEYKLKGINQSQIDHSKGYGFADGLRSILRQDPDIVMVGEMRDLETADVAINAALTGHLVISTIHTNSAAGAVPRFLAMGVKPFLLAPALNAIMGQRLVRRICDKCKTEDVLLPEQMERVKKLIAEIPDNNPDKPKNAELKFYKGAGCETCNGLGYKGRVGIYEIMAMTKEIETVILSGKVSEYDMHDIAVKNGMLTMVQDGINKALKGMTTMEEVFRVSE